MKKILELKGNENIKQQKQMNSRLNNAIQESEIIIISH